MNTTRLEFEAIGTHWTLDITSARPDSFQKELFEKLTSRAFLFDTTYSRFISDSLVTQISQKAGDYILPSDAKSLFDIYEKLYKATGGIFTPLVASLLEQAGYDSNYSLTTKKLMTPISWEQAFKYEYPKLTVATPSLLDFGAAGKGYLVDILSEIIRGSGVTEFCVDGSGDIYNYSSLGNKIRVGLENPNNKKEVIGVATLGNESICGSAGNRRAWGEFHHIINPQTLMSPQNVLATWVVTKTAIEADALATALFLVEPNKLSDEFNFEYVKITKDGRAEKSPNFPGELFLA